LLNSSTIHLTPLKIKSFHVDGQLQHQEAQMISHHHWNS